MDKQGTPIAIRLAFKTPPPDAIDAGAEFSFAVTAEWPQGLGAKDATCLVCAGERVLHSAELPEASADGGIPLKMRAPEEVGQHRLRLVAASARDDNNRAEGSLDFIVKTIPHESSLAAWDIP